MVVSTQQVGLQGIKGLAVIRKAIIGVVLINKDSSPKRRRRFVYFLGNASRKVNDMAGP